jgi:hypothetical protein
MKTPFKNQRFYATHVPAKGLSINIMHDPIQIHETVPLSFHGFKGKFFHASNIYFRWTGVFLLGASIVSTSKQFFGDPIQVIFYYLFKLNSANGFVLEGVSPCTVFSSVPDSGIHPDPTLTLFDMENVDRKVP